MRNKCIKTMDYIGFLSTHFPYAQARVQGVGEFKSVSGAVSFYNMKGKVIVTANIGGLPQATDRCARPVFAMHIHQGGSCTGNSADPLADTGGHYNPDSCLHPYHAGDMPPLFSDGGCAFSAFADGRLKPDEVMGKTVVIHRMPDDFMTQPSGNSGEKIACGVIGPLKFR